MTRRAALAFAVGALASASAQGCGSGRAGALEAPDAGARVKATPSPADGGASGFCATRTPRPAFCDDFDRGALGATWDVLERGAPQQASLDTVTFLSPPAAFAVTPPRLAAGELGATLLRRTVKGTARRFVFGFAVRADAPPTDGTLAIATLDLALDHLLTLYLRDDDPVSPGPSLAEAAPGAGAIVRTRLASAPPAGVWTRVELDVDAAAGHAVVRIAGAVVLSAPVSRASAVDPTIRVGALVTGPADAYGLRFDDVTLDLTP